MGLKYKMAPLSPRIGAKWPKIIENIIFHVFHPKYTKICPKIYRILIWPFWRHFWPKTSILTTFATEFFLVTWKFGIYVKKHGRNRRQMVVLGGCVGDLLGSRSTGDHPINFKRSQILVYTLIHLMCYLERRLGVREATISFLSCLSPNSPLVAKPSTHAWHQLIVIITT